MHVRLKSTSIPRELNILFHFSREIYRYFETSSMHIFGRNKLMQQVNMQHAYAIMNVNVHGQYLLIDLFTSLMNC